MITWDNYKIHCSSIGSIMTNQQGKKDTTSLKEMSETCKTHLVECYIKETFSREKDIFNKYIEKGLAVEEDSITLYSRVKKTFFKKNETTLVNTFLIGTPDLFEGYSIDTAKLIIDIKSSWDVFTFFTTKTKDINKHYFYQLQGYMALTGAQKAKLVYCLVDTPEVIINQEKEKLLYKMGVTTRENELYLKACDDLDRNMRFNDIPMKDRVIEFEIERNDEIISKINQRVILCREFLNQFEGKHELVEV